MNEVKPSLGFRVVGFVDNDKNLKGKFLHNIPILGSCDELEAVVEKPLLEKFLLLLLTLSVTTLKKL